eukprot:gb/GEZN01000360.1/.p1 GENE.gb/GEZN01000360.1/~~gb/GEZN01000360.1/.p1  ORF type:complete len:1538 (-),score=324.97 gb/GEZN01000360.1/:158-4666(-)
MLLGLQDSGEVDVIEVGIPFNDPIADGPLIQELYAKVLPDIPSVNFILDLVQRARDQGLTIEIILMGYCNTFFEGFSLCGDKPTARGKWDLRCAALNIHKVILVDYGELMNPNVCVEIIPVISENIDARSFNQLLGMRNKTIYCTNYLGVTGSGKEPVLNEEYKAKMRQLQANGNRTLMGFGLNNATDINRTADMYGCDMCVIGTAFLKELKAQLGRAGSSLSARALAREVATKMLHDVKAVPAVLRPSAKQDWVPPAQVKSDAKLKVCGFRTWENVVAAVMEGVDYFGFVLVKESKRYFGTDFAELERCCRLVVQNGGIAVGIFETSMGAKAIASVLQAAPSMTYVQLYGCDDKYEASKQLALLLPQGRQLVYCTSANAVLQNAQALVTAVDKDDVFAALCIDNSQGGSGTAWDYGKARELVTPLLQRKPLWMAGGLKVENVSQVLWADVVDVSSGAESKRFDGKDVRLIGQLHRLIKGAGGKEGGVPVRMGPFGGQFVSTLIQTALNELEKAYLQLVDTEGFRRDVKNVYSRVAGRPTGLYKAEQLSQATGKSNVTIWLKREDLLHTGAHKINNALFQVLLAKHMGKKRIIAETGAGQHGVAVATACARFGLPCTVYMGEMDVVRQNLNVLRMEILGTTVKPVTEGDKTLSSAINGAMRDWATNINETHYIIGSAVGPAPFPYIVRDAQSVIGTEAREQFLMESGGQLPDSIVACVGGGSNAIGMFDAFIADKGVKIFGAEAAGAASISQSGIDDGTPGVLHGAATMLMQDAGGRTQGTHSVSAGLDYAAVGPAHSFISSVGRAQYVKVTDAEAIQAMHLLARTEGILCAIETSHAIALAVRLAANPEACGDTVDPNKHRHILVSLSGRGDKDMGTASHPTRMAWVGKEYVHKAVKFLVEEPLGAEEEKMIFEFFDRFNMEMELENPLCADILSEFRRQLLPMAAVSSLSGMDCADIVGTGGDTKNSHNVSTPAGLLAAATGTIKVLKHGNVASSGTSGSADVLRVMGANMDAKDPKDIADQCGFAFVFARKAHPVMAKFGPVRKAYGKKCLFNYLGPLLNPFQPNVNVFGVSNIKLGPIYAKIVRDEMPRAKAIVVHSFDGVDKIQPNVDTHLWTVENREITYSVLPATKSFSQEECLGGGGNAETNARNICNAMSPDGPDDAFRAFVVANAAALVALNCGISFPNAEALCLQAIADGRGLQQLRDYVFTSNKQGPITGVLSRISSHVSTCGSLGAPSPASNRPPPHALYDALGGPGKHVIGEIKPKSLTQGESKHPVSEMLDLYGKSSVVAISVVTEPCFFGGSVETVRQANSIAPNKVVLRKDFILTPKQVFETPPGPPGSNNAVLLIMALLSPEQLKTLMQACAQHGVEPVVEVVSVEELDVALAAGAKIIGINNRDLNTFVVDETRSERLFNYGRKKKPDVRFIAFSGINSRKQMDSSPLNAFLIGGSLMTSDRPAEKLDEFLVPPKLSLAVGVSAAVAIGLLGSLFMIKARRGS